ncbi:MAG: Tc toxin subunit A, partial [Cyanobacteria bacterium J06555_13]
MAAEKLMTPRMVLAEFRENHPDLCSIKEIVEFGNEAKFVHQYGPTLAGGNREARIIYRSAKNLQEQAALLWSNIREATSPYFSQTLFNNLPQDLPQRFIEQQSSIPGYDRIFGNLDFIDCDHYRSIFGPAAYFVDLMRFVEQNITTQLTQLPLGSNLSLEDRRPDLARIRLDADNTSDLVPYIDLVNELLETFVKTVEAADADIYEIVKDEIFPMSLPLHLPLDEIRIYLKQLKVSLHQIYELFQPSDQNNNGARTNPVLSRAIVQSLLSLSAEEFSLIVTEASEGTRTSEDEPAVFNHYGEVALSGAEGLENVDVFLAQTNLTRKELDELIFQD